MKDVIGYEGLYAITSCGKVWSYKSKKFLKPIHNKDGYLLVNLCKNGKIKKFFIHRLVALAYIPNPDNLETIDHIDENKEHNYVNNLRWMSRVENKKRSWCKPVRCVETEQVFESSAAAAIEMNLNRENISKVCHGKRKTAGGYHWEFI